MRYGILLAVCAGSLVLASAAWAQGTYEDRTRQLWDQKLMQRRPQAAAAKKAKTPPEKPTTGRPAPESKAPTPPSLSPQQDPGDALVGITVWRLREPQAGDDKETAIPGAKAGEQWIGERVEADTPLVQGLKVRISIESARTGFLYVIDREQYADGTHGPAEVIFPTLRTHGGNNQVTAGRVTEIPGWDDSPRYFTMTTSRPDQVAEVLTVLVTPNRLEELKIGRDPVRLTPEQLREWEKKWGARVQRLEARGQAGKTYSRAEKEAGMERTRRLTHEEPLPQTMYWCDSKPGEPMLVNVPLRIVR